MPTNYNLAQIYTNNPVTTINGTDLLYVDVAATTDGAITGTNFKALFISPSQLQKSTVSYSADSGAANGYIATLSPAPASYTTGLLLYLLVSNSNTLGISTLNVNGLGNKDISLSNNVTTLPAGTLVANTIYAFQYNGTNFQVLNPTVTLPTISSPEYNIYVAKNGNDSTGTGSFTQPYLTLAHALSTSVATSATATQPVNIILADGTYNETTVSFLPFVNIIGQGQSATFLNITTFAPSSSYLSTNSAFLEIDNLTLSAAYTLNFSAGSGTGNNYVYFNNVTSKSAVVLESTSSSYSLFCYLNNCNFETNFTTGLHIIVISSYSTYLSAYISSGGLSVVTSGNVNFFTLSGGAAVTIANNYTNNVSSMDGTSVRVEIDAGSYSINGWNFTGGATASQFLLLTPAQGMATNYTPTNFTPTNTSVEGAIAGIDAQLASSKGQYFAIYQQGGTANAATNTFVSWASLCTYLYDLNPNGACTIYIDGTYSNAQSTISAGTYNLPLSVTLLPINWTNIGAGYPNLLTIEPNAIFNGITTLNIIDLSINFDTGTASSAIITASGSNITLELNLYGVATLTNSNSTQALIAVNDNGYLQLNMYGQSYLYSTGIAPISMNASGNINANLYDYSYIPVGGIDLTSVNSVYCLASSDCGVDPALSPIFLGKAAQVAYTPATPANWPSVPAHVSAALDNLSTSLSGNNNLSYFVGLAGNPTTTAFANFGAIQYALLALTYGGYNVAIGQLALYQLTTSSYNVAIGAGALKNYQDISGSGGGSAVGNGALGNLQFGDQNVGIGGGSGTGAIYSNYGVFIGNGTSCPAGTSGGYNTGHVIIGYDASTTALINSIAIGYQAQVIASNTMQLGNSSLLTINTSAIYQQAGNNVLNTKTGTSNTFLGKAGNTTTSGTGENTATGASSLPVVGTGNTNSAYGYQSGLLITTGSSNSLFGSGAGKALVSTSFNCAFGYNCLPVNTTSHSVAMGASCLALSVGGANNAFGYEAGSSITSAGSCNLFGSEAGQNITTGANNCCFGDLTMQAGASAITGTYNTAIGNSTLTLLAGSYSNNTAVGGLSASAQVSYTNCTFLGYNADAAGAAYSNAMALGYNATAPASNSIQLGNSSVTQITANSGCSLGTSTTPFKNIATAPAASASSSLAIGTAYQNTTGADVTLHVYLSVTAATTASILCGVGSTSTPTQQTIISGLTVAAVTIIPVSVYVPSNYYCLISTSGTITQTISGQQITTV